MWFSWLVLGASRSCGQGLGTGQAGGKLKSVGRGNFCYALLRENQRKAEQNKVRDGVFFRKRAQVTAYEI
jgi:hypothetical protein